MAAQPLGAGAASRRSWETARPNGGLEEKSVPGQTEKNSLRANVFRVTPESGHCSMQSACLKRDSIDDNSFCLDTDRRCSTASRSMERDSAGIEPGHSATGGNRRLVLALKSGWSI